MWNFDKRSREQKHAKEKQVEQPRSEEELEEPTPQHTELSPLEVEVLLPEINDEMLALWRIWAKDQLPPLLSLAGDLSPEKLQMKESALEREKIRMGVRLNQDAKSRLQQLHALEKSGGDVSLAAQCCCYISANKLVAWLFLFPPVGEGEPITGRVIGQIMEQAGVENGIDSKGLVGLMQKPRYFELIPIAFGKAPSAGTNGGIREYFSRKLEFEVALDENGNADYRSVSYIQNVQKGGVICDILPACTGEDGVGVEGSILHPSEVKPPKIPQGTNTQLSEDGLHLIATQTGDVEYHNNAFHVRSVLEIQGDVDYSTGNIDFLGDVHIHGDVRENFTVQAKGTITIDGLVEAASITAGGDLLISSGVVGDNRAVLRSAGNVRVKYLESCQVYAGRRVYADCIVASDVFCDDAIVVTSGRGSIIGGTLTAANLIRAKMIGARSGRQTELHLGEMPYAAQELTNMEQELEQIRKECDAVQSQLAEMERFGVSGERAAKLKIRKVTLDVKLSKMEQRKEELGCQKPDLSKCLIACDSIYPITKISAGGRTEYVHTPQSPYHRYGTDVGKS